MEAQTYVTTSQLAERIHYNSRYICNNLLDSVLIEGIHYIRPFGRRKILFIWEAIERDMIKAPKLDMPVIPMARGGVLNG